jgi:quinol monooxygenase YgiN
LAARKIRRQVMPVIVTRCRVDDFDTWRPRFDAFVSTQPALLSYRVWQGTDDPNQIVLMETWESREALDALLNHPQLEELMAADGVELSSVTMDVVDEVT